MEKKLLLSSILIIIGAVISIYDKLIALLNLEEFLNEILNILISAGLDVPYDTVKTLVLSIITFGLVFSILLLLVGVLLIIFTKKHKLLGFLSILFAILSLDMISIILGIVGGVLAILYKPKRPLETMETPVKTIPEEPVI